MGVVKNVRKLYLHFEAPSFTVKVRVLLLNLPYCEQKSQILDSAEQKVLKLLTHYKICYFSKVDNTNTQGFTVNTAITYLSLH